MDDKISEQLTASERTTSTFSLFIIWVAATTSISSIPIAAIIIKTFPNVPLLYIYGFNFLSYIILGLLSLPGFWYGIPMMKYSDFLFHRFNTFIAFIAWLSQIGWQVVILIFMTYIIVGSIFKGTNFIYLLLALFFATIITYFAPIIGLKYITIIQYASSLMLISGALYIICSYNTSTLALIVNPNKNINYITLLSSFSLIMTDSVLSWTMFSSDYSRHVSTNSTNLKIVISTFLGGGLGSFTALCAGSILVLNNFVSFNQRGISLNSHLFPLPFYVLFIALSIVGLASANSLNIYSSSLNLGIIFKSKKNRLNFALINLILVELISLIILLYLNNFLNDLQWFLGLSVVISAPWTGYIIADLLANKIVLSVKLDLDNYHTSQHDIMYILTSIVLTVIYYVYVRMFFLIVNLELIYLTALIGMIFGALMGAINFGVENIKLTNDKQGMLK